MHDWHLGGNMSARLHQGLSRLETGGKCMAMMRGCRLLHHMLKHQQVPGVCVCCMLMNGIQSFRMHPSVMSEVQTAWSTIC